MAIYPVCGREVDEHSATDKATHRGENHYFYKGQTYYFCSKDCKDKFQTDPEKYIRRL